jgi:hypothetical protein
MKKLKNFLRILVVMHVKKHFMQKETGVMKNYSCLTGPFKHIARKLTV